MKYLNQFHRESEKKKMKKLEEWSKMPLSAFQESKKHFEMHRKLKESEDK